MRFYTAFMHSPLTKVFCRDEAPRALNKAKKRWKAAFAKTRAVAGFKAAVAVSNYNKGAMVVANAGQKTCNYCHQVIVSTRVLLSFRSFRSFRRALPLLLLLGEKRQT